MTDPDDEDQVLDDPYDDPRSGFPTVNEDKAFGKRDDREKGREDRSDRDDRRR